MTRASDRVLAIYAAVWAVGLLGLSVIYAAPFDWIFGGLALAHAFMAGAYVVLDRTR